MLPAPPPPPPADLTPARPAGGCPKAMLGRHGPKSSSARFDSGSRQSLAGAGGSEGRGRWFRGPALFPCSGNGEKIKPRSKTSLAQILNPPPK